jgi:hypothetical protein
MYNIYNPSEVFYLWDVKRQQLSLIGNEKDLIRFLARHYRKKWYWDYELRNDILDNFGCNVNETNKDWQIFDGMNRCINPKIYDREAYDLYLKYYKNPKEREDYRIWSIKNKTYKGEFRREPVEGSSVDMEVQTAAIVKFHDLKECILIQNIKNLIVEVTKIFLCGGMTKNLDVAKKAGNLIENINGKNNCGSPQLA